MPRRTRKTSSRTAASGRAADGEADAGGRPLWNGSISFGLLNVPVQLVPGERSDDIHFRMMDGRDMSPIRYERVNAETGRKVEWKQITKAYEYAKGSFVPIDEQAIRKAAPDATETVEIEAFVKREEIDPRYYERPYYLLPGRKAEKGYVLLREILRKSGRIGIARVVIRTRQYLSALMPFDDALVLVLMRFPEEIVAAGQYAFPAGGPSRHNISAREMDMAAQLIESMTTAWEPGDYHDTFRERLREIIDGEVARLKGKAPRKAREAPAAEAPVATNVVDFTALLRKSL
ncbi:MAG: Ku protein, partial [Gammaproteobacteria bacterium]|nr:Ku protein [Gammaproteobacteria bacterium]